MVEGLNMGEGWGAALFALFIWWFSTGAILCLVKHADRGGRRAHMRAVLFAMPVFFLGLYGAWATLEVTTTTGVYLAFLSALAVWGWVELAFLTGVITGPVNRPCPTGISEFERFIRAWGTIAYHEMLLAALVLAFAAMALGSGNPFGLYTFLVLFLARISAKLNLFYGVRKINIEFLPQPLAHLPSHFRIARLNWVFPISITGLTAATWFWLERLASAATPAELAGYALLAALTALALLEHWLMVLPLPDEKLWRWMLPAPKTTQHIKTD
ncbi:MAG: putative photosynthetic complex assembly protein PuhE [Alkalilacustris sp.]